MHGFNRLGGNSLAETVVAGGIVGKKIAEFLQGAEVTFNSAVIDDEVKRQQERIQNVISCKAGTENVFKVRQAMQQALHIGANIFRTDAGLTKCVAELQEILQRARKVGLKSNGLGVNPELSSALKIEGQVKMALMVAYGALKRTESRGSHNREDFTARNDRDWLTRTLAYWKSEKDDLPTLEYEAATQIFHIPPGDRGYGKSEIIKAEIKG
jgi:Succinate dehydrogenase/fumarate reductase, flavoprotein subunit